MCGIEPQTCRLTAYRSANWATPAFAKSLVSNSINMWNILFVTSKCLAIYFISKIWSIFF